MTALDRYLAYTRPEGNCRIWTRARSHKAKRSQYGCMWVEKRCYQAHRYFYEAFVGPIPQGKQLHHVCLNSLCCNPSHLMVVSQREHTQLEPGHVGKRTTCPQGHPYTAENTKRVFTPGSNGKRYWKRACRECHRLDGLRRRERQRHHVCLG
jgi:hypothetical protein